MSKLTFTLALSNIFMTATPSYCSWRRSCQHQTDLLMRWCYKYATNYIIIKHITKFFLKSGSCCADLFPWLFLPVVHREEGKFNHLSPGLSVDEWVFWREMFTWKWSWTFSISTPINLAFTSKSPTSSVGEMSNMTFLNLRDKKNKSEHRMCERMRVRLKL